MATARKHNEALLILPFNLVYFRVKIYKYMFLICLSVLQNARFLAIPITIFVAGALIMLLFALGQTDLKLGPPARPVQF